MSKRRTADPADRAPEADTCECAEQNITALLSVSPEQQKTIEQFKISVDSIYEASSHRIGIYGSKILREINLSLIR
jgi:hypothetical protein